MRGKRSADDRRQELADDIRRIAGYLEAVLKKAHRLELEIPEELPLAVAALFSWSRMLREEE